MTLPTTIRGVDYPSISAASRALGVNWNTVSRHVNAGTTDRIGNHPYSGGAQPNRHGNPPPRGKEYRLGRWRNLGGKQA